MIACSVTSLPAFCGLEVPLLAGGGDEDLAYLQAVADPRQGRQFRTGRNAAPPVTSASLAGYFREAGLSTNIGSAMIRLIPALLLWIGMGTLAQANPLAPRYANPPEHSLGDTP